MNRFKALDNYVGNLSALSLALLLGHAGAMLYAQPPADCPIQLRDVTATSGISFRHTDGSSGRRYIVETITAGLATFDYDNDGDRDVYFLNGAPLPGATVESVPRNALYRNDGQGRFTDVTKRSGIGDPGYGLGVTAADYDNDGYLDLYISNFGPNVLYRNNGDGTFVNVTHEAGVADGEKVGAGVAFLDVENDGDVDLYVANYVKFTFDNHQDVSIDGIPQYAGPKLYEPEADRLYVNQGDGTFRDASKASGIDDHRGTGMGIVCLDFDKDGDSDIFVLNDVRGNFLFQNDGKGRFEEVGLLAGVAYNIDGRALGSMGVDAADYDNDGWLDLYQTSYSNELPALFRNTSEGFFEDTTRRSGAGLGAFPHVNWGTGFGDFDNDGDRDLFLANGHLQDNVHLYDDTTAYEVPNTLLMNDGKGRFSNVSAQCGDGLATARSSRGIAVEDLDGDGRLDIVVLNARATPTIIRNDSPHTGHWTAVRLHGRQANRDGVGARLEIQSDGRTWVDEVHSGRGYQSHWGLQLHVGIGSAARVEQITVIWPGGHRQMVTDQPADSVVHIVEQAPAN